MTRNGHRALAYICGIIAAIASQVAAAGDRGWIFLAVIVALMSIHHAIYSLSIQEQSR